MAKILQNLISKKYYKTRGEITQKLDVFYAYNELTQEEYESLMKLTNELYPAEEKQKEK